MEMNYIMRFKQKRIGDLIKENDKGDHGFKGSLNLRSFKAEKFAIGME